MTDRKEKTPCPTEVRLKKEGKTLEIEFDDGTIFRYPAELLRVESPSAEVQGHNPNHKVTVAGQRHVGILSLEPIGHYALRIKFDDQHDTGIYSWNYLYELGRDQVGIWQSYIKALEAKGLSRDPWIRTGSDGITL